MRTFARHPVQQRMCRTRVRVLDGADGRRWRIECRAERRSSGAAGATTRHRRARVSSVRATCFDERRRGRRRRRRGAATTTSATTWIAPMPDSRSRRLPPSPAQATLPRGRPRPRWRGADEASSRGVSASGMPAILSEKAGEPRGSHAIRGAEDCAERCAPHARSTPFELPPTAKKPRKSCFSPVRIKAR